MRKYSSAISWWLLILLTVVIGGSLVITAHNLPGLLVDLAIIALVVHLYTNTYYLMYESHLVIRAGFLVNETLDLNQLASIRRSGNILSAPALSLKRLKLVMLDGDFHLISPKEEELKEFLQQIRMANPDVNLSEDLEQLINQT